jgi:hypothetical protein
MVGILMVVGLVIAVSYLASAIIVPIIRESGLKGASHDLKVLLFLLAAGMPLAMTFVGYQLFKNLGSDYRDWTLAYSVLIAISGLPFGVALMRRIRREDAAVQVGTGLAAHGFITWVIGGLIISTLFMRSCC